MGRDPASKKIRGDASGIWNLWVRIFSGFSNLFAPVSCNCEEEIELVLTIVLDCSGLYVITIANNPWGTKSSSFILSKYVFVLKEN